MFSAINTDGEYIDSFTADHTHARGQYKCPICSEPVHLRHGEKTRPHFAHYPSSTSTHPTPWEPETQRHKNMKADAYEFFNQQLNPDKIHTEHVLGNNDCIPDVYIEPVEDVSIAVEVQHSNITNQSIRRRTDKLTEYVDSVIWIYDTETFTKERGYWQYFGGDIMMKGLTDSRQYLLRFTTDNGVQGIYAQDGELKVQQLFNQYNKYGLTHADIYTRKAPDRINLFTLSDNDILQQRRIDY